MIFVSNNDTKLIEDKKIRITDVSVRTAAWTHNTCMNMLGYSTTLPLMTEQVMALTGFTMENRASGSMTDAEAVRNKLETINKTTKGV